MTPKDATPATDEAMRLAFENYVRVEQGNLIRHAENVERYASSTVQGWWKAWRACASNIEAMEREAVENEGAFKVWRRRCGEAEERLAAMERENEALRVERDMWCEHARDRLLDAAKLAAERDAARAELAQAKVDAAALPCRSALQRIVGITSATPSMNEQKLGLSMGIIQEVAEAALAATSPAADAAQEPRNG